MAKQFSSTYVDLPVDMAQFEAGINAARAKAAERLGGDGSDLQLKDVVSLGSDEQKRLGTTWTREWDDAPASEEDEQS